MIVKKGAMKKGFFLIEALLACVLIALLVGATIHYHAQWTRAYKESLDREKALAVLMARIEQGSISSSDYAITKKTITVPASESIDMQIVEPAECTQITVSWRNGIGESRAMSAIIGADDA